MRGAWVQAGLFALAASSGALADPGFRDWTDLTGDTVVRRTDFFGNAALNPASRLPDVVRVRLSAWQSPTPSTDPFNGNVVPVPHDAHLFRLDVVFTGLVNPGGRLGNGSTILHEAFKYGPSPVFGFLEIDIDDDKDTGGELSVASRTRYLANIGRFGRRPTGSIGARALEWGVDGTLPFGQGPGGLAGEYRRSGADFVLSLCGCFAPILHEEGGNNNQIFDEGETWIMLGRYLQRAGGYVDAGFCSGGSTPGMYDPEVRVRFSHSQATDQTTISVVYALDMVGAGQLVNEPPGPVNYEVGDQTSIQEALQDLVDFVPFLPNGSPQWHLARRWGGRNVTSFLDPTGWQVYGIFGTAYELPQDSNFVWTDTGFGDISGDVDGSGAVNSADVAEVRDRILRWDGTPRDADGVHSENGSVRIGEFGHNFCLYDVTGDGLIDDFDVGIYCVADFNRDGVLTAQDFLAFGNGFAVGDPRADINHNGVLDLFDYPAFANAFQAGCAP